MTITDTFPQLVDRLLRLTDASPFTTVADLDWEIERPTGIKCWPTELHSVRDTEAAKDITPEQWEELGFQELRNLFSLSIHGERAFIAGMREILEKDGDEGPIADYIKVLILEEERHMSWFQAFCDTFDEGALPDRLVPFPGGSEEDPTLPMVLFCTAMILEGVLDYYNRIMANDESLHPLVREIHRQHHAEESRHLAFDRGIIQHYLAELEAALPAERMVSERKEISEYLEGFVGCLLAVFCSKDVYHAAGLAEPHEVRRQVKKSGNVARLHDRAIGSILKFLASHGLYPQQS